MSRPARYQGAILRDHHLLRIRQRIRLSPERGRPSLGTRGSVPAGRYDGVNSAGLFACLHVVLADAPDRPRPGAPFHLVPRLILETCRSVREALDLIVRLPHMHPFNYTLADASGALASVEAHPTRVRTLDPDLTPDGRPIVAAANHYRHPDMRPFQRGRKLDHSIRRRTALASSDSVASLDALASALSDHASGVCGHSGGHTTLWSLLADLTARAVRYAAGAPCAAPFEPMAWPGTAPAA